MANPSDTRDEPVRCRSAVSFVAFSTRKTRPGFISTLRAQTGGLSMPRAPPRVVLSALWGSFVCVPMIAIWRSGALRQQVVFWCSLTLHGQHRLSGACGQHGCMNICGPGVRQPLSWELPYPPPSSIVSTHASAQPEHPRYSVLIVITVQQ